MFCDGKDSMSDNSERSSSPSVVRTRRARTRRQQPTINQNGSLVFSAFRRSSRMHCCRKRMTKEEYHRLKHMVPSVSDQSRVSKVQVIEEAIKYIDSLHLALFQRLKAHEEESDAASSHPVVPNNTGGQAVTMMIGSEAEHDPAVLRQWIERAMPGVPSSAALKLFNERHHANDHQSRQQQQHERRCKQLPSFLDKIDRMARKRHS